METTVRVNIFGNGYHIKGDAEPEYILRLAEYINDRMEEISKNISNGNALQVAILAALNIADEYFQLQDMKGDMTGEMEQKTKNLISMLDEGLIGDVFTDAGAVLR